MDLSDLMGLARVIKNSLGRRRFTGVDMSHNPNIAGFLERVLTGHRINPGNMK